MSRPLDFALQMERDGRDYYRKKAQEATDSRVQDAFLALAQDEERHYGIIEGFKELGKYSEVKTNALHNISGVFSGVSLPSALEATDSPEEAYELAIYFEKLSVQLYLALAEEATSEDEKGIFLRLAEEEERHRKMLWKLRELIRRPEEWYPYLDL